MIPPYDGAVTVYENTGVSVAANGLDCRAVSPDGSTVYGAEVAVTGPGGPTTVQQTVQSDFLSQESRVRHVGLGGREVRT